MSYIEYIDFTNEKIIQNMYNSLLNESSEIAQYSDEHALVYESFLKNMPNITYGWAHQITYEFEDESNLELRLAAFDFVSLFQSYKSDIDSFLDNVNSSFSKFVDKHGLAERVHQWFSAEYPDIPNSWASDTASYLSEWGVGFKPSIYTRDDILPYAKECYQIYLNHFYPLQNSGDTHEQ